MRAHGAPEDVPGDNNQIPCSWAIPQLENRSQSLTILMKRSFGILFAGFLAHHPRFNAIRSICSMRLCQNATPEDALPSRRGARRKAGIKIALFVHFKRCEYKNGVKCTPRISQLQSLATIILSIIRKLPDSYYSQGNHINSI